MIDVIVIGFGFLFSLIFLIVGQVYIKPKSLSSEELSVMAIALVGFIIGVLFADFIIIQNFFME